MNQHISSCPGWRSGRQVSLRKQCEEILARRKIARASQWAEIAARVENEKTRGALCDAASTHTRSRSNAEWLGDFDTELNAILARGKEASAWVRVRERLLFEDMDRASWFSAAGVSSLEACNGYWSAMQRCIRKYYFEAAPKPCINGMNDAATPTAGEATRPPISCHAEASERSQNPWRRPEVGRRHVQLSKAKTVGEKLQSSLVCLAAAGATGPHSRGDCVEQGAHPDWTKKGGDGVAVAPVPGSSEMWLATTTMMLGSRQHVVYEHPRDAETDTILDQFQCRSSKATTRKKRFFQVAPEPKDKRARPENVSSTEQDVNMQQADLLMSVWVDSDDQLSLEDFWFATEVMGATLSVDRVLKAVKHLPHVLAAAALRCSTDLTAHLEKGEGVEAAALPTDQSKEEKFARNQAFLVLHGRLQAILDGAMQGLRPAPSLEW
ncbi:unnamed protein product [Durusdinium trenchii]|uniref:Uncharacterized protein n=1 Tax=Durusdinium trenchii TaxID=1381693 RepID=A0ABP0SI67_9DINO